MNNERLQILFVISIFVQVKKDDHLGLSNIKVVFYLLSNNNNNSKLGLQLCRDSDIMMCSVLKDIIPIVILFSGLAASGDKSYPAGLHGRKRSCVFLS